MQIRSTVDGGLAIVEPSGSVDTRASSEFERHILDLLNQGIRRFAIDCSKIELLTSAGIRIMVMLGQRLHGVAGGLVLFSLTAPVRTVFDVSGLTNQFRIVATREDALAAPQAEPPRDGPAASKVSRLAKRLLGGAGSAALPGIPATSGGANASALSSHVARLLAADPKRPAGRGDKPTS